MTVEKHTFPQSGDGDYAENFSAHLGRSNISNYVEEGMSFTNLSGTSADVTKGKAFILTPSSGVADGSTRLSTDYTIHIPKITVSLTDTALNYIYLDPNLGTNDSPTVTAYTSQSNAGANDMLIGTIDTNYSPPETTQLNRKPDVEYNRFRAFIDLGLPVYDDLTNAEAGEGNIAFATGAGPNTEGLWFYDGSAWEYSGIQSLRDADVSGVTGLIEDSSANIPTAGSEGRIFFESDTGKVKYDSGSAWNDLGVSKHSQLPDVTASDHHARYTDEEVEDAVNTLLAAGTNIGLTYSDTNNSLTVDVTPQGATSGLNADLLDGVQLANISWADVALAQSDVNTSDLGVADSNIDMGGFNLSNAGTLEAGAGPVIQGADPRDSISESTSPKGFDFSGDSGRDIHNATDVTITNGGSTSTSETITVELYDGTDTTGTLVTSESKSVSVSATTTKTITFIASDKSLDNGTYHINITQSGTTLSIDKAVEHTKGGRFTLDQTATGDFFLDNQDGTRVFEIDAITEDITLSSGDLLDGVGNVVYDQSAGHVPEAQLDLTNVNWADVAMSQSDVSVADLGAANAILDMSGYDISDGTTTIWDASAGHIPEARVQQGSTSGLDADLLDGNHAGAFVTDSGDSMSGTLTANGAPAVSLGGNLDTNGNYLDLDNGEQWLTIHDGHGNYNLKSGVDPSNTIVATSGGTHAQLAESGSFSVMIDSGTATGNTFTTSTELQVDGSGVHVLSGGFVLPVGTDAWA